MLSLRAVNQFYGSQHTLWNVNIDFPQGICTGIVGLHGMGKSTLMNCITGRCPSRAAPSSGMRLARRRVICSALRQHSRRRRR